jgi:hypothetical protein
MNTQLRPCDSVLAPHRHALRAAIDLAKASQARVVAVAVEAHLPHYAATVGEVDEELAVEEQACGAG